MTITVLDSSVLGHCFSDSSMRAIFDEHNYVALCVATEVALAKVQARLGIIPKEAASGIEAAAAHFDLDLDRLGRETAIVGYPILPLVEQLAARAGDAGRYLHWGATTQDIMDTATVLQIRAALDLLEARLGTVCVALEHLASTHRDTVMAGRTHLQHALPTTFGYKAAVWLSAMDRHRERLAQLRPRVLVGQFSGAAGSLASLGERGLEVQAALCEELELGVPSITWHSARDGLAEAVQTLALIAGSLAKIACDIAYMMTTELGEVAEPFLRHRGSSSTMPQKQNPITCEIVLAVARVVRQHAGLMLDAVVHDFERATGPWHLEWFAVPESFALTSAALAQSDFMLTGLRVFPENMRRNLACTRGLIVAEAVMMALARDIGRQAAHDIVYAGCRRAIDENRSLREILAETDEVVRHLDTQTLDQLVDPANYLGTAPRMVDRLLAARRPADGGPSRGSALR